MFWIPSCPISLPPLLPPLQISCLPASSIFLSVGAYYNILTPVASAQTLLGWLQADHKMLFGWWNKQTVCFVTDWGKFADKIVDQPLLSQIPETVLFSPSFQYRFSFFFFPVSFRQLPLANCGVLSCLRTSVLSNLLDVGYISDLEVIRGRQTACMWVNVKT